MSSFAPRCANSQAATRNRRSSGAFGARSRASRTRWRHASERRHQTTISAATEFRSVCQSFSSPVWRQTKSTVRRPPLGSELDDIRGQFVSWRTSKATCRHSAAVTRPIARSQSRELIAPAPAKLPTRIIRRAIAAGHSANELGAELGRWQITAPPRGSGQFAPSCSLAHSLAR